MIHSILCLWSALMRLLALFIFVLSLIACASAQETSQPGTPSRVETGHAPSQTREDVTAQVDRLTALVEQQQKQIEQLQKSQAELLQEIRAQKGASTIVASAPTVASEAAAGSNEPSAAQTPYDAPKERGIALGDRVRIGGYGSIR